MNRYVVASLLFGMLLANPAVSQEGDTEYEAIRRDIAALSERLQKLEQENAALKQQNEELAKPCKGKRLFPHLPLRKPRRRRSQSPHPRRGTRTSR
jgi:cell division protein FtsB